jgi:hypothetical protein
MVGSPAVTGAAAHRTRMSDRLRFLADIALLLLRLVEHLSRHLDLDPLQVFPHAVEVRSHTQPRLLRRPHPSIRLRLQPRLGEAGCQVGGVGGRRPGATATRWAADVRRTQRADRRVLFVSACNFR